MVDNGGGTAGADKKQAAADGAYHTPKGTEKLIAWKGRGRPVRVKAEADWVCIKEHGVPAAEVFFASYERQPRDPKRPVMFLFNGGPGAASAFLHMGTAGPRRIVFDAEGRTAAPPARLTDNAESWLEFADLVFVDPVGTGLSRTVHESRLEQHGVDGEDEKRAKRTKDLPEAKKGFFKVKRDIEVLCEFVAAYLSRAKRWESPVVVAGESYGGFRVGKLMRALPERGVGLSAAVMVSPAIDFLYLMGTDYDVVPWTNNVPTMALVARHHGRVRGRFAGLSADKLRAAAERFAEEELSVILLRGERAGEAARGRAYKALSELTGLSEEVVARCGGRIRIEVFGRELLRDRGLVCGLYDGAVTGPDVFPDREGQPNPDPTLGGIMTAFTAGVNTMLRTEIGLSTQREYTLLSEEAWRNWADDVTTEFGVRRMECADDMRYGLALNPKLRLLITHGWFDLVTTYFSSEQSVSALRLPSGLRGQVTLKNYDGGHMFYTWENSRRAVRDDVARAVRGD